MVDRFQHLFDSLTEEVVVIDRDLRITYANLAWIRRVGLPPSQVLGQSCHHVLLDSPTPCASEICALQQVFETGQPARLICQGFQQKSGADWGELWASPVFDPAGQVAEVIQILHPLTLPPGVDRPSRVSKGRRQGEIAAALCEVALITSSSQELQPVLEAILDQLRRVVDFDSASITLMTKKGSEVLAGRGFPPSINLDEVVFAAEDAKITWMQETRQPMIIRDAQTDPRWKPIPGTEFIRSWIGAPLLVQDRMIGILNVDKSEPDYYQPEDAQLVMAFANQAAVIIENARLYAETQKRLREQIALRQAGSVISSTLDLETVLSHIAEQMAWAVDATSTYISSFEPDRRTSTVLAEYLGPRACPQERVSDLGVTYPEEDEHLFKILQAGQHHTVHIDRSDLPESDRAHMQQYRAQSVLFIPLRIKHQLLGFAELWESQERREFTAEQIALCQGIAQQAAIALDNARLYQEMQQRLKELTLLFDASAAISTSLDPDMVLRITAQQITVALAIEGCAISLWDREQDALVTLLDYSDELDGWNPLAPGTLFPLVDYPATRWVLTQRQPLAVLVDDPDSDPAEVKWMKSQDVRSLLMVPMVVRDHVIGLLELIECRTKREFTPTEVNLCQTLANQAAAAWENARLFRETEARAREMTSLAKVGQAMTTLELDDVMHSIAENAAEAAQAEIGSVYLLDETQKRLIPWAVYGIRQQELREASFDLGQGTIGVVAQSGQPLIVPDTAAESAFVPKSEASRQIHNTLTVPLAVKGRIIGTLEVCNKIGARGFTIADQNLLSAFAAQAAIAIDNARLYQEVSRHLEDALILNKVAAAAASTLDFDEVIRRGLAALVGVRNFGRVQVLLVDEARGDLWLHPALAESHFFPGIKNFRIPLGQGITGWVAQTGKPLRTGDVRQEPRYQAGYPDTLSELCVPLQVGERIIGVLDVQSTHLDGFSENDERLLTTLTGQLSTVIENSRLYAEAQQRVHELTALAEVSQALNKAKDLQASLEIVLEAASALLDSREGSIILIDPPGSNKLSIVAERGLGPEVVKAFNQRPVHTDEGTYKRALRSGRMVEVPDTSLDPDFMHDVGSRAQAITNIPLMTEQGAIGLIALDGLPKDDNTRRLLTTLADMAAVAIDKKRLHQETSVRLAEVSTLYTLSTQITSNLSLASVLDSIVTILKLTLDCRSCSIFLIDPTGEYLQLEAGSGPSSTWKGIARLRIGEGVSGRVIAERRSIYVPDTQLETGFIFFNPSIRSLLVVPLIIRDRVIGTLSIDDTEPNAFHEEIRLLTIAAAQAAAAIDNAQLYESLQSSYTDLERTYKELRELDKMKSELVQNVSHELRTPLTFIKGYVELLQEGEMGDLGEEQIMALGIVANKAEALSRLVDDIISMQQISREHLHLELLSLADVGHTTVRAAQAAAQDAGLTLYDESPDGLPMVLGDRQRLGQVFDNLLQNAIKFSRSGGTITVRMRAQDPVIYTEVEDTGIGIPADHLSRIFERFYQVDGTTTRRFGGTGLGLAIVKQIVEAHDGEVGVTSEQNKGSLFYFTIPIASTDQKLGGH